MYQYISETKEMEQQNIHRGSQYDLRTGNVNIDDEPGNGFSNRDDHKPG